MAAELTLTCMQMAYIGLGANIDSPAGSPAATLAAALGRIAELSHDGLTISRSWLYSTAPVGYAEQPRFVNAVAGIETGLSPRLLLEELLRIEREFGRDRSSAIPNGPRTLDLDLLLLGDTVVHDPGLDLPHPRIAERAFVLVPLNEIAPDVPVVTLGRTVKELLEALRRGMANETDAVYPLADDSWSSGGRSDSRMRPDFGPDVRSDKGHDHG